MSKNYNIGGESFQRPGRVREEGMHVGQIGRERHSLMLYLSEHMTNCTVCQKSPRDCEIALDLREQFKELGDGGS